MREKFKSQFGRILSNTLDPTESEVSISSVPSSSSSEDDKDPPSSANVSCHDLSLNMSMHA
jgi:hypothetical protein